MRYFTCLLGLAVWMNLAIPANLSAGNLTPCVEAPPGLAHWWPGNGNAQDVVGHANGTVSGGLTYGPGEVGEAFQFGGNSMITFGTTAGNFGTSDFTIEYWMNMQTQGIQQSFLEKRPQCDMDDGAGWFCIRVGYNGTAGLEVSGSSLANYLSLGTTVSVADGHWRHLAWTREGNIVSVYVDGTLNNSATGDGIPDISNNTSLVIGQSVCIGSDATVPYSGAADEVDIFNRALSSEEVATIYHAGRNGKCPTPETKPVILEQPASVTAPAGDAVGFTVVAGGMPPLYYQWAFNSWPLRGATQSSLSFPSVRASQAGAYSVAIENQFGIIRSSTATLKVKPLTRLTAP